MPFPEPPHTQLHRQQRSRPQGGSGGLHLLPPARPDPREKPGARAKRVFHQLIPQESSGVWNKDGMDLWWRAGCTGPPSAAGQLQTQGNN